MKKHEADSIVRFLDSCETLLSNHEMVVLCEGLRIANDDSSDDVKNTVWWNITGHLDRIFEEENGHD